MMSACGTHSRGTRRRGGRHRKTRDESSSLGSMPNLDMSETLWWLSVKESTQPDHLNWDYFKTTFQGKFVDASYVDARRRELMNLTRGDKTVAGCEAKFLKLSRYARGMVAFEYEKCVHFEDGLRDNLRVLIAPQRVREFSVLVDKAKITEEVKRIERQNRDHERGKKKRDSELFNSVHIPKKRAKPDGPSRVGVPVAHTGVQP
ncbi:uncharacterized protein [Gossypium hirsutum]|uniref:Retrotransposon gag domain-containing protein n=1 Tax=Gossypium hirsutum TaxID=3635 RepID=A0ABM2ZHZ1_GOSHI|nr:uncharacterized protein LOC121213565 [Gossypium hirsutum]